MSDWIKVEDKLPPDHEWVLLWSDSLFQMGCGWVVRSGDGNHRWSFNGTSAAISALDRMITLWQPLPTPPED